MCKYCATSSTRQTAGYTAAMRIQSKLFLSLSLTGIALVGVMVLLMQWSVDRGMLAYVNQRAADEMQPTLRRLAEHYQANGSWAALEHRREFDLLVAGRSFGPGLRGRGRGDGPPPHRRGGAETAELAGGYMDPRPFSLLDSQGRMITGRPEIDKNALRVAIKLEESIVGYLVRDDRINAIEGYELQFVEKQRDALLAIGAFVLLLSGLIALALARNLLGPIGKLTNAADQLARGNYRLDMSLQRNDELGALARDFNQLAQTLQASESERQRWFADISHELRTPLAILQGEIEAMLDGVRPIDRDRIVSLKEEVTHLARLIHDLYELSNSDVGALKYQKQALDLRELVHNVVEQHRDRIADKQLELSCSLPEKGMNVRGDPNRLRQLLDNLLVNSHKYTDGGGHIHVTLTEKHGNAELLIEDSAPGVSDADLDRLFDHLYRAERSRNRKTGGSGLGLAICKRIVEAHEGSITVDHSRLGGLGVTVTLPMEHQQ